MTIADPTSRKFAAAAAGVGAFVVVAWPDLAVWLSSRSGSGADLPHAELVVAGLAVALLFGMVVGMLMVRALERSAHAPRLGRFDVWGAYALGIGVYTVLLVTVVPLAGFALLLTDENRSIAYPPVLVVLVWLGLQVGIAAVALLAARVLLQPGLASGRIGDNAGAIEDRADLSE